MRATAEGLIGSSVELLYNAIGYPSSSTYDESLLVHNGEDGVLIYDSFTVGTIRYPDGKELILDVW